MAISEVAQDTLLYRCPQCDQGMRVEEALVGRNVTCPKCGRPFRAEAPSSYPAKDGDIPEDATADLPVVGSGNGGDEELILVRHPSMFRANPFMFLLEFGLVCLGVVGLLLAVVWEQGVVVNGQEWLSAILVQWVSLGLLVIGTILITTWWLKSRMTELKVTSKRTILRHGLISKFTSEVQHDDVRNLQIDQNLWERMAGIGDVAISSSGQDDLEILVKGIPRPNQVADVIREMQ